MTPPELLSRIESLIRGHDHRGLTDVMTALEPDERAALVKPLTALTRSLTSDPPGAWVDGAILGIAGAGVLAAPSTLAPWLYRYGLSDGGPWFRAHSPEYLAEGERQWQRWVSRYGPPQPVRQGGMVRGDKEMFWTEFTQTWGADLALDNERHIVARVLRILRARQVDWLPDLTARLGARLRPTDAPEFGPVSPVFQLVEALRLETGLAPPDGDGWLAHWIVSLRGQNDLTAALAAEPRLADRVTDVFDVDIAVAVLGWNEGLRENLARLTRTNAVDRARTVDACIARLQRGGRPGRVKAVLAMHELFAPTEDEVASRISDYVALLPDSLSVVASMAQRNLIRIDDSGRLPQSMMIAASEAALQRPEKKIVRAQLAWVKNWLAHGSARVGPAVGAVSVVFSHPAVDLQRAGVEFVVRHLDAADEAGREKVRTAAQFLPAELRHRLDDADTGCPHRPAAGNDRPAVSLTPPVPRRLEPIGSPPELAECLLLMITTTGPTSRDWERSLEALVRYAADRPALEVALRPVTGHGSFPWLSRRDEWWDEMNTCSGVNPLNALSELIAAALGHARNDWMFDHCGHDTHPLDHVVVHRTLQLADAVRSGPHGGVLAFPTWTNGLIDPAELADRLARAARDGEQPEPVDLDQALLRLDHNSPVEAESVSRLTAIGSAAAATVAAWLQRPLPAPPGFGLRSAPRWRWNGGQDGTFTSPVVERPADESANWVWSTATRWSAGREGVVSSAGSPDLWPAVLPMHREVPAASVARFIAGDTDLRTPVPALPALAESNGAPGVAFWLALAYAMAGKSAAPRMDAVDACLVLAARRQLDGRAFGEVLGALIVRHEILVGRVVPALREAGGAGAGDQLWVALATALSAVFVSTEPPRSLADLLALAVELAEGTAVRVAVDGLDQFAARPGRSRQLVEARRLAALLR